MNNRWNRTYGVFFCQKVMKEILLCATAFSISMMISDAHLFAESIPTINKQNYSLMECESLYGNDYSIETDSGKLRLLNVSLVVFTQADLQPDHEMENSCSLLFFFRLAIISHSVFRF